MTSTPHSKIVLTIESLDNVFETTEDSLATKVQNRLQTSKGRDYSEGRDKQKSDVDYVYGVYLHKDGLMFGNKRFDVDDADNIIIDGVQYVGTPGLFELIFKRIPELLYMEDNEQVQEHAAGDERAQTQASIAGPIIEQQGIQVQIRNRAVNVDHTQEEIWKGITSCNDIE